MKCSNHYERDAVSQCVDCGKALCPECTEKFNFPLCDYCSLTRIADTKKLLFKNSAIMFVLFIFGFMQTGSLLGAYFFAGIPWGWSILNSITPNMFLFMPLLGWLIYFCVKLCISMAIGMFVTPFKLYKIVKGLSDAKKLEEYTINK